MVKLRGDESNKNREKKNRKRNREREGRERERCCNKQEPKKQTVIKNEPS